MDCVGQPNTSSLAAIRSLQAFLRNPRQNPIQSLTTFSEALEDSTSEISRESRVSTEGVGGWFGGTMTVAIQLLQRVEASIREEPLAALVLPRPVRAPSETIDTKVVEWQPREEGLVILALFSGVSTEVEALLLNGARIQKYIAVEKEERARDISAWRLTQLHQRFPSQLPLSAVTEAHKHLPHDILDITAYQLSELGEVDLVVAGWPEQGTSSSGYGQSFSDSSSHLFYDLIHVIHTLQQQQQNSRPLGYLLEHMYAGDSAHVPEAVSELWQSIIQILGQPLLVDAAQLGSQAHRLRAHWTNLVDTAVLTRALEAFVRPDSSVRVDDILEAGRTSAPVDSNDSLDSPAHHQYAVNVKGEPRRALPTFVSLPHSRNYTYGHPGMLWDQRWKYYAVPTALERERAMGFRDGSTAAPGTTEEDRHQVLGQAMDLRVATWVLGMGVAAQHVLRGSAGVLGLLVEKPCHPGGIEQQQAFLQWPPQGIFP